MLLVVIFIVATTALSSRAAAGVIFHSAAKARKAAKAAKAMSAQLLLLQVPVKMEDCLNLPAFSLINASKSREFIGLNFRICKANFQLCVQSELADII